MPEKVFVVEVALTAKQAKALCGRVEGDLPEAVKVAGVSQDAVTALSEGGMVMYPETVQRIENIVGDIEDTSMLVPIIEKGVGREDGCMIVTWKVDPVYEAVLVQTAERCGKTPQEVAQECMDFGFGNGWCYDLMPGTQPLHCSAEDYQTLREAIGKEHITGTDVAEFIRKQAEMPELVEK